MALLLFFVNSQLESVYLVLLFFGGGGGFHLKMAPFFYSRIVVCIYFYYASHTPRWLISFSMGNFQNTNNYALPYTVPYRELMAFFSIFINMLGVAVVSEKLVNVMGAFIQIMIHHRILWELWISPYFCKHCSRPKNICSCSGLFVCVCEPSQYHW